MFMKKKQPEQTEEMKNKIQKLEELQKEVEEQKSKPVEEEIEEVEEVKDKTSVKWRAEEVPTQTTKIITGSNGEQLTDIFEVLVMILNKLEEM